MTHAGISSISGNATAIAPYLGTAKAIGELSEHCSIEELSSVLKHELDAIADSPFITAIRHTLQP
jgi:hypothetical protein